MNTGVCLPAAFGARKVEDLEEEVKTSENPFVKEDYEIK